MMLIAEVTYSFILHLTVVSFLVDATTFWKNVGSSG